MRQGFDRARDAHFLAGRDRADAALPVEPLRGAGETVPLVRLGAIELRNESEETRRRSGQMAPQLRDLGLEAVECAVWIRGGGRRGGGSLPVDV